MLDNRHELKVKHKSNSINVCNSINYHQWNKPVEGWYVLKSCQINKRTKKGTMKNILKWINDMVIPLTIINTL